MNKIFFCVVIMISVAAAEARSFIQPPAMGAAELTLSDIRVSRDNLRWVYATGFQPARFVTAVQLEGVDGIANVQQLRVDYCNGTDDSFPIGDQGDGRRPPQGRDFTNGTQSRWIELPGGVRCVSAVSILSKNLFSRQMARFVVKYKAVNNGGPVANITIGQTLLERFGNAEYVNTANVCGISHVAVRVENRDAHIESVYLRFGNGHFSSELPVREDIKDGSGTRWVSLGENERCIDGFYIMGRMSEGGRQPALVSIKGLQ